MKDAKRQDGILKRRKEKEETEREGVKEKKRKIRYVKEEMKEKT